MALRQRFVLASVWLLFFLLPLINCENSTSPTNIIDQALSDHNYDWLNGTCRPDKAATGAGLRVVCDADDSLTTFPLFPSWISYNIDILVIRNQPRLRHISRADMANYPSLTELLIANTGLAWIGPETFSRNQYLIKVNFSGNSLKTLDWRSMVNLHMALLDVSENPFICNCSLHWLVAWNTELKNKRRFLSPDGTEFFVSSADAMSLPNEISGVELLKCLTDGQNVSLATWTKTIGRESARVDICSLPSVSMKPQLISISDSAHDHLPLKFECVVDSNQALDAQFRQPFQKRVVDANETNKLIKIESKISYSGKSFFSLLLSNATQGQMGWYICVGLSASGPSFDMAALTVKSKPTIKFMSPDRKKSTDHYIDTFKFKIFSFPPPSNFSWLKNHVPINFADDASKLTFSVVDETTTQSKSRGFFYISRPIFIAKLRFTNTFYEGDYSLVACNSVGCSRLKFITYNNRTLPAREAHLNYGGAQIASPTEQLSDRPISESGWIVALTCTSFGLFMCGGGIAFYYAYRRNRRPPTGRFRWTNDQPEVASSSILLSRQSQARNGWLEGTPVRLNSYTSNEVYEPLLSSNVPVIRKESLEIVRTLGQGAFGEVYLAYCDLSPSYSIRQIGYDGSSRSGSTSASTSTRRDEDERSLVAAKTLKSFSVDRSQELAKEAELMAKLNHPNIVTFYGACLQDRDDLLLLYEYMELGDLKGFLSLHGLHPELHDVTTSEPAWRLTHPQLIEISRQVAQGLAYLHEHHFVHRDLACRNCLVKSPLVVKLSDFGMTRDIYSCDYYRLTHKAPLPVRWLPPESLLYGRFSNYSDVWSYGVVVWEISSFGQLPWCEYSNVEVMQRVSEGATLRPPDDCPPVLRQVMTDCWKRVPSERAKLEQVIVALTCSE